MCQAFSMEDGHVILIEFRLGRPWRAGARTAKRAALLLPFDRRVVVVDVEHDWRARDLVHRRSGAESLDLSEQPTPAFSADSVCALPRRFPVGGGGLGRVHRRPPGHPAGARQDANQRGLQPRREHGCSPVRPTDASGTWTLSAASSCCHCRMRVDRSSRGGGGVRARGRLDPSFRGTGRGRRPPLGLSGPLPASTSPSWRSGFSRDGRSVGQPCSTAGSGSGTFWKIRRVRHEDEGGRGDRDRAGPGRRAS